MKRIYCLMVTLLLVVCASAQTKVTGTVYEEAGVDQMKCYVQFQCRCIRHRHFELLTCKLPRIFLKVNVGKERSADQCGNSSHWDFSGGKQCSGNQICQYHKDTAEHSCRR